MNTLVDNLLAKLAELVTAGRYASLETDTLEIKPVPSDAGSWLERYKSVNAFLNTRGGILILGIREDGQGPDKRWVFTGWREEAEPKLKEFARLFTDRKGNVINLQDAFPPMQLRPFLDGQLAIVYVDELPADRKFVFYRQKAWKRSLTGDHQLTDPEIATHEEYIQDLWHARELQPVRDATLDDLDIDPLNDYIQRLNHPVRLETIKPDIPSARSFLERKGFVKDGQVTTLGMLVCGRHPEDRLGFRCHVHGYVDVPQQVAQDKQDLIGNLLPLMDSSLAYVLRNIQIGVSIEGGGKATPQYPEDVLRETINNALAHRDYAIEKQAIIAIKPGVSVSIRNPGAFRRSLILESDDHAIPLRRIIPEAKARNPKLADVLRVYRKWEGKGIGMATLVNLCLENRIDLPTYRLYSEEVCLILTPGPLVGERMKLYLESFDAYIANKLGGSLTDEQAAVLCYLLKSEWANQRQRHTIMLTPDNNHFDQLLQLERGGLIEKHPRSTTLYPIYIADRVLMPSDYRRELEQLFGNSLVSLDPLVRKCLGILYRHGQYSRTHAVTAKMAAFALWYEEHGGIQDIREFDSFYRKVRYAFNKLEKGEFVKRASGQAHGFLLNESYSEGRLL